MNTLTQQITDYKEIEILANIKIDDIIHKVTQEISELSEAAESWDIQEMYKEAWDVLVNVLSAAQELWCSFDSIEKKQEMWSVSRLLKLLWDWNSRVQWLRWVYSRDNVSVQDVEDTTRQLAWLILNYTDPSKNLWEIIQTNTDKFMSRVDQYLPQINIEDYIANYPDFPKPGIQFKDISPILASPEALKYVCIKMANSCRWADKIVALDARWFIFAPMIAQILWIPWVMARKPGKLPGETESISYTLEYGTNTIEIQKDAITQGEKVAIVDDLLATWGTAEAAASLVEKSWGEIHNMAFVIGLDEEFLLGKESRKNLEKYNCSTVVSYD